MKGSTIIKIVVVVAAIGVVGYVIHHSNRAAEITELVNKSPEKFNLNNYVDSIADAIKNTSSASSAYKTYNDLYEEIDVYAHIAKSDGSEFVEPWNLQVAYEHAFAAYWPFLNRRANEMFQKSEWTGRSEIRAEVNSLLKKQGITPAYKDSLARYQTYITGYGNFESLLRQLESCKNAETYNKLSQLNNYAKYPYRNLSKMQSRRNNAEENAKEAWQSYLRSRRVSIQERGYTLMRSINIDSGDVMDFGNLKNEWNREVESYERTIQDYSSFTSEKELLEDLYREVANKYNGFK